MTTVCAEEDNVNIPIFGDVNEFIIEAAHPNYPVTTYTCLPDFTECNQIAGQDYTFTPETRIMYDDGAWVLVACRESSFWRPRGMSVRVESDSKTFDNAHYIAVSRKVLGEASWPQFLVIYADGNLRLIPHPPGGVPSVCFGASVVVGPAVPSERPWCEISDVTFDTLDKGLLLHYADGGRAKLSLTVDRNAAAVRVSIDYATAFLPFATFRSMFVQEYNCDTALATVYCHENIVGTRNVLEPFVYVGDKFVFSRNLPSVHNMSAPDIIITVVDPNSICDGGG